MTETDYASAVALIGMSGRFPGAGGVAELWRNLLAGTGGLRELTEEELRACGIDPGLLADPRYVRVGGPVADLDRFDATVFGINPREAETMDPQHRLFLECSWEALEGAGYCPIEMPCQVAVFAGCGFPDYVMRNVEHLAGEPGGQLLLAIGNERDSLASMVSYKLDLRGPAMTVQTFCSTSLVSVHMACQSLLTYECDVALAGGAFTPLPEPAGYLYEQGGILSPDGRVRSFDADANGTVMGAGVGVVALKRMADALADGDLVHAVIIGSAVNNDGRLRAGYTAPGVEGEAEVIGAAIGVSVATPETIGYVECHATGTMLGDSIELAALNRVFTGPRETPCVLGSLKPVIGHLDRASGVTGLIRAALALEHEVLPATPGYRTPNPALVAARGRFEVLTENRPWPEGPHPRRAGVNSFGLGGTNAHVVLEQAPKRAPLPPRPGPHLLVFSAAGEDALTAMGERLAAHLAAEGGADLADVAYTLQVSRGGFARRRALVCRDRDDAIAALADPSRWIDGKTQRRNLKARLVADPDIPQAWWERLRQAVEDLLGPVRPAGEDPLDALGAGLARLGVVLADEGAERSAVAELVVAPSGAPATEWLLGVVAELWIAGCAVDWGALHRGLGRRVALPTYPFQRHRYWIEDAPSARATTAGAGKTFDRARWTYLPTWRQRPLPTDGLGERLRLAGPWLVLCDDERGEAIVDHLARCGAEVTAVRAGTGFGRDERGDFTVRPDDPADFAEVLSSLLEGPRTIVHAFSLASPEASRTDDPVAHFDAEQRRGFHSALALCRELVDDGAAAGKTELVLLTSGAVGVAGPDLRHPEHATTAALGPSLTQENARLRCRSVDVGEVAPGDADALEVQTTRTLAAIACDYEGPVAVRADETWNRHYQPHPLPAPAEAPPIREGETVLITGGLGDVGLTLARHLANRYGCKLVLTARSPLPPRERWQEFLAAVPDGGERTARHLRNVLDLESRGATVLAMSADAADATAMRAVVDAAVARFGRIDVVVHGAGVQDGRFFDFAHLMDRAACDAHLAVKVKGFHVLQAVLGDQALDRRITLSSVSAVLGGIMLAPYTAANAALDAYARVARSARGGRWVTVDWDTWMVDPERLETHSSAVLDFAMTPAEGVDVFERALAAADQVGHLVISTGSLDARIAQWVVGDIHEADEDYDDREHHPRPELDTPFVAPREGVEAKLAETWSRVLSIEPIGALDNFFELGGNSLLAIELTARIRKALNATVAVTALLESPTVRDLATRLDPDGAAAPDMPAAAVAV